MYVWLHKLSEIVLLFWEELKLLSEAKAIAEFCEVLNNVFDLTNCQKKLGKGDYYCPIND